MRNGRRYADMRERIIANTVISQDSYYGGSFCWIWTGSYTKSGYPKMGSRWKSGPRKGKPRTVAAHRVAITAFTGRRLTHRMVALHLCNNTSCCNPEHLSGGTQKANVRQAVKEGRHGNQYSAPVRDAAI